MGSTTSFDYPWVIFTLQNTVMAISSEHVESMVNSQETASVPHTPDFVRGVINLRGIVAPFIDLRVRLGMPSFLDEIDEFCSIMDQREQDHRNWLEELEESVRENHEFKLATDPHKCAFGKWYDNYKPTSYGLATLLRRFDTPHRKIHGIAEEVVALEKKGDLNSALKIIEECRDNELAEMVELFAGVKKVYRENNNEVAIVIKHGRDSVALAVDTVESVEHFEEGSIEDAPDTFGNEKETEFVKLTGRSKKDGSVILVLDTDKILEDISTLT